jgi:predicted nucleic acid-binding protein
LARIASIEEPNETLICSFRERVKNREFAIRWVQASDLEQFLKLACEIKNADYGLEPSDALIIAQSLVDAKCRGLLTFDGDMMASVGVKDVVRKHRAGFVITDKPP